MIERWDFCTHKHADPNLSQVGPCPLHDAVGYCQECGHFIFDVRKFKEYEAHEWMLQKFDDIAPNFFKEPS